MNMEMSSLQICFREVVDRVGVYFRAQVPGGGAIAIHADGDLTIAEGVFISANGGDARADGIYDHGGGGSGGAIRWLQKIFIIKD